ncbi:MAG: hypothetical protein ABRQ25_18645 [Clostridiaceae bacterium]
MLSHNVFVYCFNNTINNLDNDGHFALPIDLVLFAVAALSLVTAAVLNLSIPKEKTTSVTLSIPITNPIDKSGPVIFRNPKGGATLEEKNQIRNYVNGCNRALKSGYLSPIGRVPTKGRLSQLASAEAKRERNKSDIYVGLNAGHVPDTTWTGKPVPFEWLPLAEKVNKSLGAQSQKYPLGYKPTIFIYIDVDVSE